jgi:ubiquinone/menaquinone biosynthesis C-methylase UbiE
MIRQQSRTPGHGLSPPRDLTFDRMAPNETSDIPFSSDAGRQIKAAHRHMWALGDYHRFATSTVWQLGPVLVDACRISAGQRVLDVATGTGNVAIRAAKAGATVVASDFTAANFEAGCRAAAAEGVELEWREADAEALPFEDGEFDVITSCFGAIFAPHHRAVANELVRVCRPGGTIGMINFTPEGAGGDFFELLGRYAPSLPTGALPPILWGREDHVRNLFADRLASLELTKRTYVEVAENAHEYVELFRQTFGPMIAIREGLAESPERLASLNREFMEFVRRWNRNTTGDRVEVPYQYLLVVARKGDERVR